MKSIEQYKYKAINLRIFGIGLMSPFASLFHKAMTESDIYDILSARGLISFIFMLLGFIIIGQGNEILEQCDELLTRNN